MTPTPPTEEEAKELCYPFGTGTCNNPGCNCRAEKRDAVAALDSLASRGGESIKEIPMTPEEVVEQFERHATADSEFPLMSVRKTDMKTLLSAYRAAQQRIAELERVVERLPKTADGVRVTPGMQIFSGSKWVAKMFAILDEPEFAPESNANIDCFYSTAELHISAGKDVQHG